MYDFYSYKIYRHKKKGGVILSEFERINKRNIYNKQSVTRSRTGNMMMDAEDDDNDDSRYYINFIKKYY